VVLDRLRVTCVEDSPRSLGPYQVLTVRDLWTGFDSAQPDNRATLPQENMLTLTLSNGGTATVRASGTEPKIKYYCEVGGAPGQPREEVEEAAAALREAVVVELLRLEEHGISLQ
jgi:phosphomannomutase